MEVGSQRHAPYRRLGGLQGRSGRVRKISPPPGFDPRTVQSVASRYNFKINLSVCKWRHLSLLMQKLQIPCVCGIFLQKWCIKYQRMKVFCVVVCSFRCNSALNSKHSRKTVTVRSADVGSLSLLWRLFALLLHWPRHRSLLPQPEHLTA